MKTSTDDIKNMSYTDFVGFVNQWNVPPGAYSTVNKWAMFGQVEETSRVLEVACTTGFSLCNMAKLTGCSGMGIDISENSITAAEKNKAIICPESDLSFAVIDGYDFLPQPERYTHIIIGAALRFFPDSRKLIEHLVRNCLVDGGKILSCEFYAVKEAPSAAIELAKETFDITPTSVSFKEVMKPYRGLDLYYQDNLPLFLETNEEIEHYSHSTIKRMADEHGLATDSEEYVAAFERLVGIKRAANELRRFQNYATLVHQYENNIYPNRYTELF